MAEIEKVRPQGREYYEALFREHATSGVTLKAFGLSRGLNLGTFYAWHRQLRPKARPAHPRVKLVSVDLVEPATEGMTVVPEPPTERQAFEVVLLGNRVVRVHAGFDGDELVRLVSFLESSC